VTSTQWPVRSAGCQLGEVNVGGLLIDAFLVYAFKATRNWLRGRGSEKWPSVNATITTRPTSSPGFGCDTVEIVYSYRFEGELYTGLHEEPFLFVGSLPGYVGRFPKGASFVVRVKPGEPEVSVVREDDQDALVPKAVSA
jgi:hypothetical protein